MDGPRAGSDRPQEPVKSSTASPASPKPSPARAASAEAGMVPVSNDNANELSAVSNSAKSTTDPAEPQAQTQVSSPRKSKLQRRLEKSIAEAVPTAKAPSSDGFIASVSKNKTGKTWTITLNDDWYQLAPEQQEAIAASLWGQKEPFKFQRLTLKDRNNKTIARNPVVGDQMVILRR